MRVKSIPDGCEVFRCSGNEAIWMSGVCASLHIWSKTRLFPWQPLCICTIVAALPWMWRYQASLLNHAHILLPSYSAIKNFCLLLWHCGLWMLQGLFLPLPSLSPCTSLPPAPLFLSSALSTAYSRSLEVSPPLVGSSSSSLSSA